MNAGVQGGGPTCILSSHDKLIHRLDSVINAHTMVYTGEAQHVNCLNFQLKFSSLFFTILDNRVYFLFIK
jgi:hypothetical protein